MRCLKERDPEAWPWALQKVSFSHVITMYQPLKLPPQKNTPTDFLSFDIGKTPLSWGRGCFFPFYLLWSDKKSHQVTPFLRSILKLPFQSLARCLALGAILGARDDVEDFASWKVGSAVLCYSVLDVPSWHMTINRNGMKNRFQFVNRAKRIEIKPFSDTFQEGDTSNWKNITLHYYLYVFLHIYKHS